MSDWDTDFDYDRREESPLYERNRARDAETAEAEAEIQHAIQEERRRDADRFAQDALEIAYDEHVQQL